MIDGLIAGAVVVLVDRVRPRRRPPKLPKPPKAECGCGHSLAVHDPESGRCNTTVKTIIKRSGPIKNTSGYEIIGYKEEEFAYPQCGCRQYTGPRPLESFYAPEITP